MQFMGYGLSDRGRNRPVNEDAVVLDPSIGLWIVCDGMGGHAAGDLAARTAAQAMHAWVASHRKVLAGTSRPATRREKAASLMRQATLEASKAVFQLVASGQGMHGMGTTLTALLTHEELGVMAHVGDSRLYVWRGGTIHQLSDDHTIGAELVRRGTVSQEKAHDIGMAKALSRAVGVQPSVEVDSLVFDVLPDDTFLLCSDGLTRYLQGMQELAPYLSADDLAQVPAQLVGLANQRGGRDNVSVVAVRVRIDAAQAEAERAHHTDVVLRLETLRHISLFQHLTLKELVHVMNRCTRQSHREGETIIHQGDPGDGLYVILEGSVGVSRGGSELAVLGAGTHFGEMALLNDRPRSATVTARESTRLMKMSREAFHDLMRQHASLAVKLLWTFAQVLSARLAEASEHIFNIAATHRIPVAVQQELEAALGDPRRGTPDWRWR